MTDCLYRCDAKPNVGLILVTTGRSNGFGGIVPGVIWCWSHGGWDPIPDAWHDREEMLRDEISEEWRYIRRNDRTVFRSPELIGWVTGYCEHRGWRKPDFGDRYKVFRFMEDLEREKPLR